MVRGAPTALNCFFVGFRTDFVTSVMVVVASAGGVARAGLKTPRGLHPFRPPLATSLTSGISC